jgi:hypothetical protein
LGLLAIAVLLVGLWPAPLLDVMRATTQHLAEQLLISKVALYGRYDRRVIQSEFLQFRPGIRLA